VVKIGRGEPSTGGDAGKADQGMHDRQLSRVVELETRDPPSTGENGRLRQLPQRSSVEEGFQDVLWNAVVVVNDH